MNNRINSFVDIYKKCNSGSNKEKYINYMKNDSKCPAYIDVELTNCCNINCYMCPVGTKTMHRKQGFMSLETVEQICKEAKKEAIQGIRLVRWGEPTLHPQFLEILEQFKNTGKAVHFNTNGILLNQEKIEKIIALEIDSIKFSFQGVDKYSYEEMRSGSSWDTLLNNIKLTNHKRGNKEKPYIQISTTITDETTEQLDKFKEMISSLCDYFNIGNTELSYLDLDKMGLSQDRKEKFLELREKESLKKRHLKVCPEVFDKLSINWDGTVTACCSDYDNQLIIGDLKSASLKEIFQNEKMEQIRKIICDGNYDDIPLCKHCYEYIELRK